MTVKESKEYDNCLDMENTEFDPKQYQSGDLSDFIGDEDITPDKEWKKHWKGMPEFEQEDKKTYKTIYLHFRNEEDFKEFSKKYKQVMDDDQNVTPKTKSMWYPHLDKTANSLLRWIEDE